MDAQMKISRGKTRLLLQQPFWGSLAMATDFIEDNDAPSPTDQASQQLLRDQIDDIFVSLTPREVRILQLRFGLVDGYSYTLEEVGKKFGVTRERIRQIEAQALGRLRHPSRSRKLRDFLA